MLVLREEVLRVRGGGVPKWWGGWSWWVTEVLAPEVLWGAGG
jgi:hypothetical protein